MVESLHLGHLLVGLDLGEYRQEEDLEFGVFRPHPRHAMLRSWQGVSKHEMKVF